MLAIQRDIIQFLKQNNNFLITTHISADGDAYGSVLSIAYFLEELGKQYQIIVDDEKLERKYDFMWGFEKIHPYSENSLKKFSAAIVLDVPTIRRIGSPAKLLPSHESCVKIDHHPPEDYFADYSYVDSNASSTSYMVYQLLKQTGMAMTDELANLLFSGIMYDTGRFSFSNTTQKDFEVAAELLKYKVSPYQVSNRMFFNNSYEAMKIIGFGLANLESHLDGKLVIIYLPKNVMDENYHSEIEELANYSVSLKGVEVGLFIREVSSNFFKISFRSRGHLDVNRLAKSFGGGGHAHAAGCRFKGKYSDLKKRLLTATEKLFK
jgi:phosphoesterase RecJ-like protein